MNRYIVLFRTSATLPGDAPFGFACMGEDTQHAEEQCTNAYPGSDIVWVVQTGDYDVALMHYYNIRDQDPLKEIKEAFQRYRRSEGCGCCSVLIDHREATDDLGRLLGFPRYDDDSGYNFYIDLEDK
jgi:hypothetical protein